jgi:hypothetical protein
VKMCRRAGHLQCAALRCCRCAGGAAGGEEHTTADDYLRADAAGAGLQGPRAHGAVQGGAAATRAGDAEDTIAGVHGPNGGGEGGRWKRSDSASERRQVRWVRCESRVCGSPSPDGLCCAVRPPSLASDTLVQTSQSIANAAVRKALNEATFVRAQVGRVWAAAAVASLAPSAAAARDARSVRCRSGKKSVVVG